MSNINKKKVFFFSSLLILAVSIFFLPLTFAQAPWYSVKVSAYAYNLIENNLGGASLEFTVASPPSGSEISNTISAIYSATDENFTVNLTPGDSITVTYTGNTYVDHVTITDGSESNYFIIDYEGEAGWLMVNGTDIPEFTPILIVPMFIAVTLLALIYRRKHKT